MAASAVADTRPDRERDQTAYAGEAATPRPARSFECGATAQVPLDYDQPHGATISLALIRLPATDPAHRIGSLFLNPGGPGGSGVDFVRRRRPVPLHRTRCGRASTSSASTRAASAAAPPLRCFGSDRARGAAVRRRSRSR